VYTQRERKREQERHTHADNTQRTRRTHAEQNHKTHRHKKDQRETQGQGAEDGHGQTGEQSVKTSLANSLLRTRQVLTAVGCYGGFQRGDAQLQHAAEIIGV